MDNSFLEQHIYEETMITLYEQQRPSVLFKPDLKLDGDKYSVLYGSNIMEGIAGFGDSADEAMRDFDRNWRCKYPKLNQSVKKGI